MLTAWANTLINGGNFTNAEDSITDENMCNVIGIRSCFIRRAKDQKLPGRIFRSARQGDKI